MKRTYFFKDKDGVLKRYYYCSLCGKGPFIKEQLADGVFFIRGHGNQPTVTCRLCDVLVYPRLDRPDLVENKEIQTEEISNIKNFKKGSIMTEPATAIDTPPTVAPLVEPVKITVIAGQIWKDKDKRRNRTIKLIRAEKDQAYYIGGIKKSEVRISIKRLMERFEFVS